MARELGIPAVVGSENATQNLRTGTEVTISCADGETGFVYAGVIPFDVTRTDLGKISMPRTQIMVNLGNPDSAYLSAFTDWIPGR